MLAEAAIEEGYHTTWMPLYGVEKRGGDATVTVIISKKEVGSPVLAKVDNMIVMHQRMWEKYGDRFDKRGLLIVNSSIVEVGLLPEAEVINVPATDIAISVGSERAANMVLLGVFVRKRPIVDPETVKRKIEEKAKPEFVELNIRAFEEGLRFIR